MSIIKVKKRRLINTGIFGADSNTLKLLNKSQEAEQQYETPLQPTAVVPRSIEGKDGDMKLITEGVDVYLYVKVDKRWMKTQLQEVS
tara:strand:- start:988 stop:1248 length:261 start_codon:yes stop_codon:yes gene_type:complete